MTSGRVGAAVRELHATTRELRTLTDILALAPRDNRKARPSPVSSLSGSFASVSSPVAGVDAASLPTVASFAASAPLQVLAVASTPMPSSAELKARELDRVVGQLAKWSDHIRDQAESQTAAMRNLSTREETPRRPHAALATPYTRNGASATPSTTAWPSEKRDTALRIDARYEDDDLAGGLPTHELTIPSPPRSHTSTVVATPSLMASPAASASAQQASHAFWSQVPLPHSHSQSVLHNTSLQSHGPVNHSAPPVPTASITTPAAMNQSHTRDSLAWTVSPIGEQLQMSDARPKESRTHAHAHSSPYYYAPPSRAAVANTVTSSLDQSYVTNVTSPSYHYQPPRSHVPASPAVLAKTRHALEARQQAEAAAAHTAAREREQLNQTWQSVTEPMQRNGRHTASNQNQSNASPLPPTHDHADVPVDVASRLVARDHSSVTVEVQLSVDGGAVGSAQASGASYEEAESRALLAAMERCDLPSSASTRTRGLDAPRLSGPYFASGDGEFTDDDFPLSPTRPPRVCSPHTRSETYAPDADHSTPFFGYIPPPVADTQPRQCDAAAMATNLLFAREHVTRATPDMAYYYARADADASMQEDVPQGVAPRATDPRHRLQEYLLSKSLGAFDSSETDEKTHVDGVHSADAHVRAHEEDVAHPFPHSRPRAATGPPRPYYVASSAADPRRQLFQHFLEVRTRGYADLASEVSRLRRWTRDRGLRYDQTTADEREQAFMRTASWASPRDARAWLARVERDERNQEAPSMAQSRRTAQHARRHPRSHLDATAEWARDAAPTPQHMSRAPGTKEPAAGWRRYSWHWRLMREAANDARAKLEHMDRPTPADPHARTAPAANAASSTPTPAPTVRRWNFTSPAPLGGGGSFARSPRYLTRDPLPARPDLPLDEWSRTHSQRLPDDDTTQRRDTQEMRVSHNGESLDRTMPPPASLYQRQ